MRNKVIPGIMKLFQGEYHKVDIGADKDLLIKFIRKEWPDKVLDIDGAPTLIIKSFEDFRALPEMIHKIYQYQFEIQDSKNRCLQTIPTFRLQIDMECFCESVDMSRIEPFMMGDFWRTKAVLRTKYGPSITLET